MISGGIVSPSALAGCTLTTSSMIIVWFTGKSAGLEPLKIAFRRARSLGDLTGAEWAGLIPPRSDDTPLERVFAAARLPAPGNALQRESYELFVALVVGTSTLGLVTRKRMAEPAARDCLGVINISQEPAPVQPQRQELALSASRYSDGHLNTLAAVPCIIICTSAAGR